MIRRFSVLAVALLLVLSVGATASEPPRLSPPSAESLARDVGMLAHPNMEGRGSGAPGGDRAAREIARALEMAGLRPGGDRQTFFQSFAFAKGTRLASTSRFDLLGPDARALDTDREWRPHAGSRQGEVTGDVVFVGHGITTPDGRWDDYRGVDVRGRIALALDGAPAELGARVTSRLDKLLAARRAGASALVLVSDPLPPLDDTGASVDIVSASVTRAVADALRAQPRPVRIKVDLETAERHTVNVIGILPGRDPARAHEAVVIGAHHDHLGVSGGQIYHGADDNASGTAAVMGLARAFAAAGGAPRTLVFALFGGEELGLLGSKHYVSHPSIPMARTIAMVNLDMVGRLRGGTLTIGGVDTGIGLRAIVDDAAAATGVAATSRGDAQSASDHSSFYHAGTPALFFHTGGHADYHKPTDTADRIDTDGLSRVATLAAAVVERIAAAPAPAYAKVQPSSRRERAQAPAPAGAAFLGVGADGVRRGDGVHLREVVPGSAAEKAGVRAGDVLVRLGGEIVDGFEDVQRFVAARKPGDTIELVYLRNGEARTASTALGERP